MESQGLTILAFFMNTQEIFMSVATAGVAWTLAYMGGRRNNYWYLNLGLILVLIQKCAQIFT